MSVQAARKQPTRATLQVLGEQLLSPAEASKVLAEFGISACVGTLKNWRARGRGPRFRRTFGRSIYYEDRHLREWAAAQLSPPVASTAELPRSHHFPLGRMGSEAA